MTADVVRRQPHAASSYAHFSTGAADFVGRHALWTDAQRSAAERVLDEVQGLDLIRVAFGDPHGLVRSKTLTSAAFRTVMRNGMDFSPGPFVFDTGHAVAIDIFADGGGIAIPELTGAGDFIVVPDPDTFRVLPYTEARIGWVIGDEYLRNGDPHPLSSRAALRRTVDQLVPRNLEFLVGLEVEWYLTRYANGPGDGTVGGFGSPGQAPRVTPVNRGYQFNLDLLTDQLMPVLAPLARAVQDVGLPLRTIEHESGPGQLEFTFDPMSGLAAADAMLLFRSVAKQVCARYGYHASFMTLPAIDGFDASGWHLHQSLFDLAAGRNAFCADEPGELLSTLGRHYLGGLLDNAPEGTLLGVPTINGYRRLNERFSLSPDRITWSPENRGAFVRVLGGYGELSTHLENRVGEPCANPYLYLVAQLAAGMDGVSRHLEPGPPATDPHATGAKLLPGDLEAALHSFSASSLYRSVLGEQLFAALLALKRSELSRYTEWVEANGGQPPGVATEWEQSEYFGVF
jgi:glutamine synthetase